MKKFVQYFVLSMAMVAGVVACSKEEPVESKITDYYIECTVSGGGLDASELNQLQSELNYDLSEIVMEGFDRDEAIYIFDGLVKDLKDDFSYGMDGISETLKIKLTLKTIAGKAVKSYTLNVTKDGCKIA